MMPASKKKLNAFKKKLPALSAIIHSEVNSKTTPAIRSVFKGSPLLSLQKDINIPIKIKLKNKESIGRDRLLGAYAALQKFKTPLLVIDIGSALTFNTVNKACVFEGGLILPGPGTQAKSLNQQTDKLPEVSLKGKVALKGLPTTSAIRSGIILGLAETIRGLIKKYKKELGIKAVVVTGGGYALLKRHLNFKHHYESNLVLEGIAQAWKKAKKT